jgi:hypothetical protein
MAENAEAEQQELFQGALGPEPAAEPAPAPAPQPAAAEPAEAAIPSWRLREEADARRAAEDRVRAYEEKLKEYDAHLKRQQPQKVPDWFENPDAAMQEALVRWMGPIVQDQRRQSIHNSRMIAGLVHGRESVDAAEAAFLEAHRSQTLDPMDYERVVQSPNRYDAVVDWHRRNTVVSTVGNDPNAWFVKKLDEHLGDPRFQAALMERIRGSAATRPGTTRLPPSLSGKTSAMGNSGEPVGDLSDASLYAFAKPERKGK